jgi:coatomer subunit beta'
MQKNLYGFVNLFFQTSSDDMSIKLWNWDKNWACQQVFEGHTHYVMQIVINPKDNNTFASASLDRTVKVRYFTFRKYYKSFN